MNPEGEPGQGDGVGFGPDGADAVVELEVGEGSFAAADEALRRRSMVRRGAKGVTVDDNDDDRVMEIFMML